MIHSLDPVQFNFTSNWTSKIRPLRQRESIQQALLEIRLLYQGFAEMKYEDHVKLDTEQAEAE